MLSLSYEPGLTKIVTEILKPASAVKFLPKDLRSILWCLRRLESFHLSLKCIMQRALFFQV